MNGEPGDCNTPVRRSARARKPNSRFAEDELDGCIKKIVAGVSTSENAGSVSVTPTRQRKQGKKRESECEGVDENLQSSKEAVNTASTEPQTQSLNNDAINGLVDENVTTTDTTGKLKSSPEKPQERRTRSNARKDDLESLPMEEKKRGRKGPKGKGKGSTDEKMDVDDDKSCVEFVGTNKDSPKLEKSVENMAAEDKEELPSTPSSKERAKGNLVKKQELPTGKDMVEVKELEMLPKDDDVREDDDESNFKEIPVERKVSPSKSSDCGRSDSKLPLSSEKSFAIVEEGVGKDNPLHGDARPNIISIQSLVGSMGENVEEKPTQKEGLIAPAENKSEVGLSGDQPSDLNLKRGQIDFSEAETSTPSRGRKDLSGTKVCTPQRRSTRSASSENEVSLGVESISLQPIKDASLAGETEEHTGTLECKASPMKRRGRSAKQTSKEDLKTVLEEKLLIEPLEVSESSKAELKTTSCVSGVSMKQDSLEMKTQKDTCAIDITFSQISEGNVSISQVTVEKDKVSFSDKEQDDLNDEAISEKVVTKGKRNRSEQLGEGGTEEGDQDLEEFTKQKKMRDLAGTASNIIQEGNLKRKRENEPNESEVKRKRQKSGEKDLCDIPTKSENLGEIDKSLESLPSLDGKDTTHIKDLEGKMQTEELSWSRVESKSVKKEKKRKSSYGKSELDGVEEPLNIEERRQSSVGSILSLLKRPDISKKIESNSNSSSSGGGNKAFKTDFKSENKRQEDRNWRKEDFYDSENKRQEDRKWRKDDYYDSESKRQEDRKWKKDDFHDSESKRQEDRKWKKDDFHDSESKRQEDRKWKKDDFHDSDSKRHEDRKWKKDDSESKRHEDRKWKKDEYHDSLPTGSNSMRKDEKLWKSEEKLENESGNDHADREDRVGGHYNIQSKTEVETQSSSDVHADTSEKDDICFGNTVTWENLNEMTSSITNTGSLVNKKPKPTKKSVESGSLSKSTNLQNKESEDDKKVVEERRTSSIGNILSFLKRGSQSGGPPKQEDNTTKDEDDTPETTEDKIFSFVESSRKSFGRDDSFSSYNKQENNTPPSKNLPKTRERKSSRWVSLEDPVEASSSPWENVQSYPSSTNISSQNKSNRSSWTEQQNVGVPSFNKWEAPPSEPVIPVRNEQQNVGVPSFNKWEAPPSEPVIPVRNEQQNVGVPSFNKWEAPPSEPAIPVRKEQQNVGVPSFNKWEAPPSEPVIPVRNEQQNVGVPSFSKWEAPPSEPVIPVRNETKEGTCASDNTWSESNEGPRVSENTWSEQRPPWKNWSTSQGEFQSPNKIYSPEGMESKFREIEKETKENASDDENIDFGNREGISEFIESYADELDQSGEEVLASNSQPPLFHDGVRASPPSRKSTWSSKDERSLSPHRDIFRLSSEKELSSPPRERAWSPQSSEVPLSPKSRELMSSLMNMEVKLTPQMQELISAQKKPDPVLSKDLLHYPGKHDVIGIPLPNDSDIPGQRERLGGAAYGKSEFSARCPETSPQVMDVIRGLCSQEGSRNSSNESTWRSSSSRHGRFDVKSEHGKDMDDVKDEDEKDEHFDVRKSRMEEIHDDKENLEPKIEEEDKLEYQRKIQRDIEAKEERNRIVVEQRMKLFGHIRENLYLSDRKKSKRSKEVRRMVCDCSLTKEEIARGEVGCGEDCLNRLLMMECGSRCPLKERCTNKRFQNFEYADVEVFNAGDKGCGIRARKTISAGTFIMEYVGEVFDSREFKRRRKEYSRNLSAHFYFMALKGDLFIDATRKGNISRFINHSCDPNAQTQKWTINGELRVGFFAQKMIEAGEEINFDYRLERYGREPQKCYCGTAICRGWLGESPDEKTKEEKEEERRLERDRRKREEKRSYVEDVDLEDEIEKLNSIKLRTRQDVLNLCRLMVRADNSNSRVMLLRLVQCSTSACKRLFMDYHGLSLLWSWMADLGYAYEHASIKIEILKTLECLPITNKTQLTDSRVLGVVERWSTQSVEAPVAGSPPPPPPPRPVGCVAASGDLDSGKKSSDTSEDSDGEMDTKPVSTTIDSSSIDDISMDSVEQEALKSKPSLEGCLAEEDSSDSTLSDEKKSAVEPGEGDTAATTAPQDETVSRELLLLHRSMVELAIKLLEQWKDLKEYFRIPKKERIELMKEHEREVEEEIRGLDKDRKEKDKYRRDFDRRRRSPDREKDKDRYSRRSSRSERESKEDRSSDSPKMSKEQRRQLFEIQVQQEEEAKQRKMQEEMWAMHVERCRLLGQDPYLTPIFDPTCQYYWDPNTASWQPYNGTEPNIPVPAAYGYRPSENGEGSPMIVGLPTGHVIASQTLTAHLSADGEAGTPNGEDPRIDIATIPLPGEIRQTSPTQPLPCQAVPVEGTPPQGARVLTFPVPTETGVAMAPAAAMPVNIGASALAVPFVVGEEPPPPPPGPITIQLPPRWKMARDSEGHVYFYHVKSRTSQWEPPTLEQHQKLEAEVGSDSDSNDSSSSDSDSTSTTDSEDFSSDEEEEEEVVQVTTVEVGELCDEKMIRRHRAKKPRSEALVQERVISPVLEVDKETARRERREAKERAQKEVRQERQEDRSVDSGAEILDPNEEIEPLSEKMQRLERSEAVMEKERSEYREKSKIRDKIKSKERAATAIADNSDSARKSKENFRAKMATYIVSVLNPYRKEDCKIGRITCNEDFKYLARKLTHFVMIKELKQLHSVEDLECNDSVKYKTKDFVRKYMSKYGYEFKRDPTDTKEY